MERISKYVSLSEVTKSNEAIRLGLSNIPNDAVIANLKLVCTNVFDKVREHFNVPIRISSGYRSPLLNKSIGGASNSQHCLGQALDIDADILGQLTNSQVFNYIKDVIKDYDQLIWEFGDSKEPAWVHVSYVGVKNNRKQILVATKDNKGKSVYVPYKGL